MQEMTFIAMVGVWVVLAYGFSLGSLWTLLHNTEQESTQAIRDGWERCPWWYRPLFPLVVGAAVLVTTIRPDAVGALDTARGEHE